MSTCWPCGLLTALDNEISNKVYKVKQLTLLKKALMQDLLTGKIRVKVDTHDLAEA
ncbi:restriction endonuclease subunit S [Halomonas sp. LS-001]